MKLTYVVGGVMVVLIAAIIAFLLLGSNKQSSIEKETPDISQPVPSEEQSIGDSAKETVETIKLTAVAPYTGSGTANRSFNDTNFIHLVTAKIDPPKVGKFYEGWLVKNGVPISTGKMSVEGGDHVLLFTSKTNYSDHNQVVITEETESLGLDGKPETHVLEGTFQ